MNVSNLRDEIHGADHQNTHGRTTNGTKRVWIKQNVNRCGRKPWTNHVFAFLAKQILPKGNGQPQTIYIKSSTNGPTARRIDDDNDDKLVLEAF